MDRGKTAAVQMATASAEVTRILKADPATRHIRVMAFTAFAMRGDEAKMRHAGCDGYLSKPIDVRTFGAQVQACLAASDGAPWCPPITDSPSSAV